MNLIKKLCLLLVLAVVASITLPGFARAVHGEKNPVTLYPPLNLSGTVVYNECYLWLSWQKPQLPSGSVPPGLIGYYIYRDGVVAHYVGTPDSLMFFDYPDPLSHFYTVTANYDMTAYGYPGLFEQSPPTLPVYLFISNGCINILPFREYWDSGTFAQYDWKFIPSRGNWGILTTEGNPPPTAIFTGVPLRSNYSYLMRSPLIAGINFLCAGFYLDFDYKLDDILNSGTEKLTAVYATDTSWTPLVELKNQGSTGWIHVKTEIPSIAGHNFKIGFRASGIQSSNISRWSVDNIIVSVVCKDPFNGSYSVNGNEVNLTWDHPCGSDDRIAGYRIYRTDSTGNPPFNCLNSTLIQGLHYQDTVPASIVSGQFRYTMTAVYVDSSDMLLCESPGLDTLTVDIPLGMSSHDVPMISILPNPAHNFIIVNSSSLVEYCELFDLTGRKAGLFYPVKSNGVTIQVSGLPDGIYLLHVKNASGTIVKKVSVMH